METDKSSLIFWWDHYNYLENHENSTQLLMPELYIYSDYDSCVDSQDVKNIVRKRSQITKLKVLEKNFQDSKHVSHFDKYSEEYQKVCLKFFQDILLGSS